MIPKIFRVLQTEDGIEVLPFRHFADLLAD